MFLVWILALAITSNVVAEPHQTTAHIKYFFGLQDYMNVINVFFLETIPAWRDIVKDINAKLNEFQTMNDLQVFISHGSLHAQYIQLHSVWSLQDAALIPPLQNLTVIPSPTHGPYMRYCSDSFEATINALNYYVKGHNVAINGILNTVIAIRAATTNPQYNANNTIEMTYAQALAIKQSVVQTSTGNKQVHDACIMFSQSIGETIKYQIKKDTQTFEYLNALGAFKNTLADSALKISDIEKQFATKIFNSSTTLSGMVQVDLSAFKNAFVNEQMEIAKIYSMVLAAGNLFEQQTKYIF